MNSREHKKYLVVVYTIFPRQLVARGTVQASAPCKAAELFMEERQFTLPIISAPFKIAVVSHVGIKFVFDVEHEITTDEVVQ